MPANTSSPAPATPADSPRPPQPAQPLGPHTLSRILDLARWAPSGDNTQPWRFEIIDDHHLVVHGRDTRRDCVYDLRGHASQIALGALIETIAIAASEQRLAVAVQRRADTPDDCPDFDIAFTPDAAITPSPLLPWIEKRVTQRRPLRSSPLTDEQMAALRAALPSGYRVQFKQTFRQRWRIACLLFQSAHIRLTTREAFETHRNVIEWNATTSLDRIPDKAVGVDELTRRLMRWVMGSWSRAVFLNRFCAGTIAPRLQLDFLPGLRCGGHFFLIADKPAKTTDDFVAAGRALQRFWLTATQLGLLAQPEMTPLIFAQYVRDGVSFTANTRAQRRAARLTKAWSDLLGADVLDRTVFMGRLGFGTTPLARSLRLPVDQLMARAPQAQG